MKKITSPLHRSLMDLLVQLAQHLLPTALQAQSVQQVPALRARVAPANKEEANLTVGEVQACRAHRGLLKCKAPNKGVEAEQLLHSKAEMSDNLTAIIALDYQGKHL